MAHAGFRVLGMIRVRESSGFRGLGCRLGFRV